MQGVWSCADWCSQAALCSNVFTNNNKKRCIHSQYEVVTHLWKFNPEKVKLPLEGRTCSCNWKESGDKTTTANTQKLILLKDPIKYIYVNVSRCLLQGGSITRFPLRQDLTVCWLQLCPEDFTFHRSQLWRHAPRAGIKAGIWKNPRPNSMWVRSIEQTGLVCLDYPFEHKDTHAEKNPLIHPILYTRESDLSHQSSAGWTGSVQEFLCVFTCWPFRNTSQNYSEGTG